MELFDRIQHPDSLINRIQDKLVRVINAIARKPVVDGVLVTADVGITETLVEHRLGRVPQGWIAVNSNTLTVSETQAPDENFLYLIAGGALSARKFWVF